MTIRLTPDSERIPFRVFLTYENGYYLDISLYREVKNETTGQTIFQTYTVGKTGPLDGRVLHDPYETKDHLQYKRFTAKSNNTSYVYDFPEMFRQALLLIWKQYSERKDVFTSEELILDTKNQGKKNECFFLLSINYIF
jgi:acetyl-CoA carboxylase/biotin carboxylase 1